MHDLFDFPEKPGLPLVSPHTSSNKALFVCALREMNILTVSQNVNHLSAYTSQKVKQDVRKVLTSGGVGLFCILIYANVDVIDWNQCIRAANRFYHSSTQHVGGQKHFQLQFGKSRQGSTLATLNPLII